MTPASESMAQPSRAVPRTTSIATGRIALSEVRATLGWSSVEPRSSFITPVRLAIASTPRERENDANELHPERRENVGGAVRGIAWSDAGC